MIYAYDCAGCGHAFDVVKPASRMEDPEQCPQCQTLGERRFLPERIFLSKTQVRHAEYNPAFGKVIKNEAHLKNELAKHADTTGSRMVEVGNDYGGGKKMIDTHRKRKEAEREERWANLKVDAI